MVDCAAYLSSGFAYSPLVVFFRGSGFYFEAYKSCFKYQQRIREKILLCPGVTPRVKSCTPLTLVCGQSCVTARMANQTRQGRRYAHHHQNQKQTLFPVSIHS
jgi:hypothetical protein